MSGHTKAGFPKGSFDVGGGGGLIAAVLRWLLIFLVALGIPRLLYGVFVHYGAYAAVPATLAALGAAVLVWNR